MHISQRIIQRIFIMLHNNLLSKFTSIFLRTYHITCLFVNISFYLAFYTQKENCYNKKQQIYQRLKLFHIMPTKIIHFTLFYSVQSKKLKNISGRYNYENSNSISQKKTCLEKLFVPQVSLLW